nr:integrase, catalytic region, zinc finger, CCHC-type, peptidase aspartic, catalytic [Tanacetum cinerariifolium]
VPVAETFHEQTDDELIEKDVKQMKANDQASQIILMGLSEDIYAAVDSCETGYRISSNPRNRHIAQLGMNMGQDRQMQMVEGNCGNQFGHMLSRMLGIKIGIVNQNPNRNGNVIAARAKGNANCQNDGSAEFIQIYLWFLGTVRFGNDHVAAILGYGDLQWGNILITRVYFVEGLGQNLFLVRQFCDSDLERLHLFHMDLCGPMSIASINGKRYVLVIVDDYSRYTWARFLKSKDEAP